MIKPKTTVGAVRLLISSVQYVLKLKYILFTLFTIVLFFSLPIVVDARQGCCSWHGGVCGCGCCDGTPLSSTCAPYYPWCYEEDDTYYPPPIPPCRTPDLSNTGSTYSFLENRTDCTQSLTIDWQDVTGASDYSLYLSKSTSDQPDDISDTKSSKFTFYNLESGKKYIHIKAKNSCGWSQDSYWTIDVPFLKPSISVREKINSEDERELVITSNCAKSISATSIGTIPVSKKSVVVRPTKDTEYIFTAKNGTETTKAIVKVQYPLPTPTLTPSPTPIPTLTPTPTEGSSITRSLLRLLKFNP